MGTRPYLTAIMKRRDYSTILDYTLAIADSPPQWAPIPGWHCWQGVTGLWYGRRIMTSPPVVLRAETPSELRAAIEQWNRILTMGWPLLLMPCVARLGS
jgi:hypothetical protein